MKAHIRFLWQTGEQVRLLVAWSRLLSRIPLVGRALSLLTDNMLLYFFGIELTSTSLDVGRLVIGHSTGVVLGGNGIRCTGTLQVASGVVFARRYAAGGGDGGADDGGPFFDIEGDLTVGANSVLLGPLKIRGPVTIGALTLVSRDIVEPGTYIGQPARKMDRSGGPAPQQK